MTNLELLQAKYPTAYELSIIEKKKYFNAALKAQKAASKAEPYDQAEEERITGICAALWDQIKASGAEIPDGTALKGFSL